jgi:putative transposase
MSRGVRKSPIYVAEEDPVIFLDLLGQVVGRFGWICPAYCLMPNHYHVAVITPEANVADGMKRLNGLYAQGFNRRHGFRGHVFEDRYRSVTVVSDDQFLRLMGYVVLNPVKPGMCAGPDEWPWSSYPATVGAATPPPFLATGAVLQCFDRDDRVARELYRGFVYSRLEERRSRNRIATAPPRIYGLGRGRV